MWTSQMMSQGFGSAMSQIGGFIAKSKQAKSDKLWQKYNNAMVRLQDGLNQNVLTTNENIAREAALEQRFAIRRSEYTVLASANVAAAASGTVGRSVTHTMNDIKRNAARADAQVSQDFEMQKLQITNQRVQSGMQAQMSLDLRKITGPSPIALALGLAGSFQEMNG
jgi:hypothetical protein